MKKILFSLSMICLILFSFTSCQTLDDLEKELNIANTDAAAREYGLQLIEYVNEKDSEGIKSMFCEYVRENGDLDEQIYGLYQYLGGKIVSYDDRIVSGSENSSVRNGETVLQGLSPEISNAKTENGSVFFISMSIERIFKEKPQYEGVFCIDIWQVDENGKIDRDTCYVIGIPDLFE